MSPRPASPRPDRARPAAPSGPAGRLAARAALLALLGGLGIALGLGRAQGQASDPMEDYRIGLPSYVAGDDVERPRVIYRDSTISRNNVCAVRHARLDPDRDPVYVNGQPIGFCCTPCPAVFSMNPERYLIELQLTFRDPVARDKKAIIDSSRRLRIGQDIYFFAGLRTMDRFKKDPIAYCGKLTDPVTHVRFRPTPKSPHVLYRSRDYWFAADSSKATFQETPARYAERLPGT